MAKLNGNTLIETIVAMVVIIFCTTMATVIYLNVLASQNSAQKLRAFYLSKDAVQQSLVKKDFLDASTGVEGMKIEKTCKPYKGSTDLVCLKIVVTSEEGKKLWEQTEIVLNE
ncbi:MAG TPA: hypothetical protein VNY73_08330 [Bacteroidia bacterium]|nr:hypothetical protein [Bacteroidia bacterium]